MASRPCVLVHGGWCGGWHWDDVRGPLERAGVTVFAPTLTGMAERACEARRDTRLATHVGDVVDVLDAHDLRDVVLVGHSYGGAVVTGAARRRSNRIAAVVYLDAFVPAPGESLADILGDEFIETAREAAMRAGTPHLIPPLFSVEETTGWTGARAAAHAARLCSQPLGTAFDAIDAAAPIAASRAYIACMRPAMPMFDRFARAARASRDWLYFELPCPHDAAHAMPAAVAGIVESLAQPS